jgi:hypothetical protein
VIENWWEGEAPVRAGYGASPMPCARRFPIENDNEDEDEDEDDHD